MGAGDAEFFVEVAPEFVLAAVAAREREVGGAVAAAAGEVGDELGVLVVGVRREVEDGAGGIETLELVEDFGRRRRSLGGGEGARGKRQAGERDDEKWKETEARAPGEEQHEARIRISPRTACP